MLHVAAPSSLTVPAAQGSQEFALSYLPAGQLAQKLDDTPEIVPGLQSEQVAEPIELYIPAAHPLHSLDCTSEAVPSGQAVHDELPITLNVPAAQGKHSLLSEAYFPATQGSQASPLGEIFPVEQPLQGFPIWLVLPASQATHWVRSGFVSCPASQFWQLRRAKRVVKEDMFTWR